MSDNNINIGVGADLSSFQKAINEASNQLQSLGKKLPTNDFDKLNMAARATEKDIKNLTLAYGANSDVVKEATNKYLGYKNAIDQVNQSVQSSIGVAPQLGNQVQKAAGQFNVLGNSVNQLTRELPAFTYSVQTGFLALSNNIPMFVDSINSIRQANMELAASGQPVQSVFSQLTSALFSWNTAISLGITAVTMFGPQIAEFATNMLDAESATKSATKAQQELNKWVQEYVETDYQRAIRKENEETAVKLEQLRELVRLQSLSVEQSLVPGKARFDVVMERKKTLELLEMAEKEHKRRLAEIDERYNKDKQNKDVKQAEWEINLYEDKFTKMKDALIAFKSDNSYQAALDLTLPKFDPDTINQTADELSGAVEQLIKPFSHVRTEISSELNATLSDMIDWVSVASNVMVQASSQLGQAFVTGDFESAGEAIVKQLGGIALQIGAAMLAIGIPQAAVGIPSGFAYIAGGTALSILGGVMQATGQSPGSKSSSGGGGGYQSNYVPYSPNGGNNFTFDGVVRGSNLEIVLINTRQQNRRIR